MSDATGIPSAQIAPKRRSLLAAFLNRLVKEKPLGTASGIIILIWILIAIFAHPPCPAQCHACRHHHVLDNRRRRNPEYCFSELPRIRSAAHDSRLGRSAQPGRASIHGAGALAGGLARSLPDYCRLLSKHARRRHAGPPRPQAQGRLVRWPRLYPGEQRGHNRASGWENRPESNDKDWDMI